MASPLEGEQRLRDARHPVPPPSHARRAAAASQSVVEDTQPTRRLPWLPCHRTPRQRRTQCEVIDYEKLRKVKVDPFSLVGGLRTE